MLTSRVLTKCQEKKFLMKKGTFHEKKQTNWIEVKKIKLAE